MPAKLYRVKLTKEERVELKEIISKGKAAAHKQTHVRILLLSDENSRGLASIPVIFAESKLTS